MCIGPKTLCNACGVRYQRSQSKAKSNKRLASERRNSPVIRAPAAKQQRIVSGRAGGRMMGSSHGNPSRVVGMGHQAGGFYHEDDGSPPNGSTQILDEEDMEDYNDQGYQIDDDEQPVSVSSEEW